MTVPNDKRFDVRDYRECDPLAKALSFEVLEFLGFQDIVENTDESNGIFEKIWDIKGTHKELGEWRIEGEIKRDWGTKWIGGYIRPFKFSTMDIPYRKRNKAEEHATHHIVFGKDGNRAFVVERDVVLSSPVEYKQCRNREAPEPFFKVFVISPHSFFLIKSNGLWQFDDYKEEEKRKKKNMLLEMAKNSSPALSQLLSP